MYTCSSVIRSCFPPSSWLRADDERSASRLLTLSSSPTPVRETPPPPSLRLSLLPSSIISPLPFFSHCFEFRKFLPGIDPGKKKKKKKGTSPKTRTYPSLPDIEFEQKTASHSVSSFSTDSRPVANGSFPLSTRGGRKTGSSQTRNTSFFFSSSFLSFSPIPSRKKMGGGKFGEEILRVIVGAATKEGGEGGGSRKTDWNERRGEERRGVGSGQMINELLLNRELSYRAAINIVPDKVTNLKEIQYKSHGNSIGDLILAEELSLATETPLITPFSSPLLSAPLSLPPS